MGRRRRTPGVPTPLEEEVLGRLTLFEAQVIRDAFGEKSTAESDRSIADRMSLPLELIQKARLCRLRTLVPAEVSAAELKRVLRNYKSVLERAQEESTTPPRACRIKLQLPRHLIFTAEAEAGRYW